MGNRKKYLKYGKLCPACCKQYETNRNHTLTCSPDCRKTWCVIVKRFKGDKVEAFRYLLRAGNADWSGDGMPDKVIKGIMDGSMCEHSHVWTHPQEYWADPKDYWIIPFPREKLSAVRA